MPGRDAGKPALTSEESAHRAARARWKRSRALGTHSGKPRETLSGGFPCWEVPRWTPGLPFVSLRTSAELGAHLRLC